MIPEKSELAQSIHWQAMKAADEAVRREDEPRMDPSESVSIYRQAVWRLVTEGARREMEPYIQAKVKIARLTLEPLEPNGALEEMINHIAKKWANAAAELGNEPPT